MIFKLVIYTLNTVISIISALSNAPKSLFIFYLFVFCTGFKLSLSFVRFIVRVALNNKTLTKI